MSALIHEIPPSVCELLDLSPLETFTDAQARGAVCVWDATETPLASESAVDLGERQDDGVRWVPCACRTHTGRQAYRALLDHAPLCVQCVDDAASCPTGIGLRRLMRDGRQLV
ncbi:hypothetical protein ACFRI7_13850 [Streptomyces sp. NPDC056716]|uniref:hypothetical protein n=1 Tax=Streptomyces sp. NPDC056716 TaxID=3345922 RepID=UPI00367848A2